MTEQEYQDWADELCGNPKEVAALLKDRDYWKKIAELQQARVSARDAILDSPAVIEALK